MTHIHTMLKNLVAVAFLVSACSSNKDEPVSEKPHMVSKTNPMTIYMHYMPWFQSKDVSGYWGSHWRMDTANPEVVDSEGKRQIASHYYPLIGPYDSKDPDVLEYHLLLMKYAGVDGVLLDWYSSFGINDYRAILNGSNALIDKMEDTGLKYAVVYEDYTAEAVQNQTNKNAMDAGKADISYMQEHYFNDGHYIRIDDQPLLLTFGPRFFKTGSQWVDIFSDLSVKPKFLTLWNHGALTGDTDSGEFSWVDFNSDLSELHQFYGKTSLPVLIGSAYPRFDDYYQEGGWGDGYGSVPFDNGQTLRRTLEKAKERNVSRLQLITWNDFGEGTVMEPTLEDGFLSLTVLQEFTGVSYTIAELELIHDYYSKKKKYHSDDQTLQRLNEAYQYLNNLQVDKAKEIIQAIE